MSKKNEKHQESSLDNIEGALTRTEQYIEENRNLLLIIVAAVIIVVGGFMGVRKFILEPKDREAQSEMYMAERYFEQDSFRLALDGDIQYPGFEQIIDDYKFTKAAKVSHYYAGVSYLRLGEYEDAISHLKKFKSKDKLVSVIALGCLGDAYSELEEYDQALSYYLKAAKKNSNNLTSGLYLKKAGIVYEELGDFKGAADVYKQIKQKYPESEAAKDIDKYIAAAELKQ